MQKFEKEIEERYRAMSQLKSRFISIAAHQLRTPLTGLKWSLQWLLEQKGGPLTAKQASTIQKQLTAVADLMKMVNELLDVALVEEGKFRDTTELVSVARLLKTTVAEFAAAAQAKHITLTVAELPRQPLNVTGDPVQLKYALANLVDNAIRYTKENGRVTVEAASEPPRLVVRVVDTGIGISPADQSKLFARFFRAGNAQRLHPDGSGLGLFIVKNIITGHGGGITVSSVENQGTTFSFTLPLSSESA